jgi:hypothetical protein
MKVFSQKLTLLIFAVLLLVVSLPASAQVYNLGFEWNFWNDFRNGRPNSNITPPTVLSWPVKDTQGSDVWTYQYKDSLVFDGNYTNTTNYYYNTNYPVTTLTLNGKPNRYRAPTVTGSTNFNPVIMDQATAVSEGNVLGFSINSRSPSYLGAVEWVSPVNGTIQVTGTLARDPSTQHPSSMEWSFDLNSTGLDRGTIQSGTLPNADSSVNLNFTIDVNVGDSVFFVFNRSVATAGQGHIINAFDLKYTLVPEPVTVGMVLVGLGGLLLLRRRRA